MNPDGQPCLPVNSRFTPAGALCRPGVRAARCRPPSITFGPMGQVWRRSEFSRLTRSHGEELFTLLFRSSKDPARRGRLRNQRSGTRMDRRRNPRYRAGTRGRVGGLPSPSAGPGREDLAAEPCRLRSCEHVRDDCLLVAGITAVARKSETRRRVPKHLAHGRYRQAVLGRPHRARRVPQ